MRALFLTILAGSAMTVSALADQTDSRLDGLFEELRTGDGRDSEAVINQIQTIWADAQSDTVDVLYQRANTAADSGHFDLAEALLDHAVGLAPSFAQAYALRGAIRLQTDDAPGAIADFSHAVELETRQFDARIALSEIMLASGDKRGAYDMLQEALQWNPHEEHARERAKKLRDDLNGQEI